MKFGRLSKPNDALLELIQKLDRELAITDGNEHDFYHQFNGLDDINHFIIACIDDRAIACGAFKRFSPTQVEIKRMYVLPEARGNKYASKLLNELENWAKELKFESTILETGKRQKSAIRLYKNCGYQIVPNYGQYENMDNSVCFSKNLH